MSLLLSTRNFDNFLALFNSYVEPVTSDNLREVLYLLRSVSTTVAPLLNKTWINGTNNTSVLTPPELEIFTALTQQRRFLGFRVAMVLSQPRKTLEPIDLGGTALDSVDLKGADLRQCVSASAWNYVNLDGADLRGMTGFEYAYFLNTAWWQAGQIDTAFLDDLMARYPHQAGQFLNTRRAVTPESYQQDVARLRALAEQAGGTAAASGTMPSST